MRNQSIVGSKLPELSEAAEQEKGDRSCLTSCPRKTECAISSTFSNPAKGVHFLNLRENLLQFENNDDDDDDHLLCFFFLCHPFTGRLMAQKCYFHFPISRWHDR